MDGRWICSKSAKRSCLNRYARAPSPTSATREIMGPRQPSSTPNLSSPAPPLSSAPSEEPAVAMRREPFCCAATISPAFTIAAARFSRPKRPVHRRFEQKVLEHLKALEHPDPMEMITSACYPIRFPCRTSKIAARCGLEQEQTEALLAVAWERESSPSAPAPKASTSTATVSSSSRSCASAL